MIERHWRGVAKHERANDYVAHLRSTTLPALDALDGFLGATILRRSTSQGIELVVVTRWASLDAIHAFAGSDPSVAVVPANVAAMMVTFDERVRHYDVVD